MAWPHAASQVLLQPQGTGHSPSSTVTSPIRTLDSASPNLKMNSQAGYQHVQVEI